MKYSVNGLVDIALSKGVPASPIYNLKQIAEDDQIANVREMLVEIEHPAIGHLKVIGNPIKLIDMPSPTWGQ